MRQVRSCRQEEEKSWTEIEEDEGGLGGGRRPWWRERTGELTEVAFAFGETRRQTEGRLRAVCRSLRVRDR